MASPNSSAVGSPSNPLRVAVVGAGPAGFYTVQQLFQLSDRAIRVDLFDRQPTPFGLVRSGVAPDHPKIKAVAALYHKLAMKPEVRFFGNVEFGKDVTLEDLFDHYHQVVFSNGAQNDRNLGIPGEELKGVHSAREFVAWYNGDPAHAHDEFDLTTESAVVVGVGNVAADVARILCRVHEKLAETDIADYALDALDHSQVKQVWLLGRRGPVQAKFSPPEIRELGELLDTETSIPTSDMVLDPYSQAELDAVNERDELRRRFEALTGLIDRKEPHKHRKLVLRFLVSPVEILGDENGNVRALKIAKNELYRDEKTGWIGPRPTGEYEEIACGLIFRSVGYKGTALPGLPFDERNGVIPNDRGRVLNGESSRGLYTAGWIKRGPSGLIGSNKVCAKETVERMLEDLEAGVTAVPGQPSLDSIDHMLAERGIRAITYDDWLKIDEVETTRGQSQGRPRVKLTELDEILRILDGRS